MTYQHNLVVILHQPQREVNIGGTVRAMLNMGVQRLRLVDPVDYDPARIDDLAHRSHAFVSQIEQFATLPAALQDVQYLVGFTARQRGERSSVALPEVAPLLRGLAEQASVGLLFGREDFGLNNADLAHCTHVVNIPTAPDYPSLNLADAVLLALYEINRAVPMTPTNDLASYHDLTATLDLLDQTLIALRFARTEGQHAATLRTFREILSRTSLTQAEINLINALCRKIQQRMRMDDLR